jgi:ComF family protein
LLSAAAFAGKSLGNALFPVSCAFCGVALYSDIPTCNGCRNDLPALAGVQPTIAPLTAVVTPFEYAFPVDAAVKAMKFRRKMFYVPAFAHLLMASFPDLPDDIDALLPMPLHWRRHAVRGFNQAAEIARPIQKVTGLPLVNNVIRHRSTPYQSGLTASQRKRNLANAFRVKGRVDCKHVLIIDDVITTGETCRQLAKVVLDAGARQVSAIAMARTRL